MTRDDSDDSDSSIAFDLSRRDCLRTATALGLAGLGSVATDSAAAAFDDSEVVPVGAGSYARRKPRPDSSEFTKEGQKWKYVDPSPVVHGSYLTDDAPPTPSTNTWWSHNWFTGSGHQHGGPNPTVPLPWYVDTNVDGLTAIYSNAWLNDPGETQADRGFVKLDFRYSPRIKLMHSAGGFGDSRIRDWGDFHTTVTWGAGTDTRMDVTFVKGSPFIFAEYSGGDAEIRLADLSGGVAKPSNVEVWEDRGNVLGVTIQGIDTNYSYERHFGIFAPGDATWEGVGSGELSSSLGSGDYLTIAPLPSASTATLDLLEDYAYNVVRDTTVSYDYVPTDESGQVVSEVRSTFEFVTEDKPESSANGSLAGLMPHQWKYTDAELTDLEYWSPRGTLKVHAGTSFQTTKTYPGILPHMPDEGTYDESTLQSYVDMEESAELWAQGVGSECSTYWISKDFDHHLRTIPIAQQVGDDDALTRSLDALQNRLKSYLTVQDTTYGTTEEEEAFAYWDEFGSLIGYPAQFYSSDFVNDHHFHYGYFVKAAAALARMDGQFVDDYGDMVDLLVREYANWERPTSDTIDEMTPADSPKDAFPYLRNFDAYEGHSWAAGFPLGDGNDQESSSEAMMANASIITWAEQRMATADDEAERQHYREMRDTGIALYTEEMHAIWEYWFDNDNDSHPDDWGSNLAENETSGATGAPENLSHDAYEYASIVWGDGYHRQTFWGQTTMEEIWGINWLPIDGHSFYLNYDEAYADANYSRMVEARGGDTDFLEGWHTAAIGYRALSDPADAVDVLGQELPIGRKSAHIYHWAHNMNAMGTPVHDVVADVPQAQVFEDANGNRTYVAYNADGGSKTVTFSDGFSMQVPANSLQTSSGDVTTGARSGGWIPGEPPEPPANLSSPAHDASSVDLTWDASPSDDVDRYVVRRDGNTATEVSAGTTSVTISDLDSGTAYDFSVFAVDTDGQESTIVGPIEVTTDVDEIAPAAPTNLSSPAQGSGTIDLAWDASTSSDVDHYVVSRDGQREHTVPAGETTTTVTDLAPDTSYDFAVVAVDDADNASGPATTTASTTADTEPPTKPTNLASTGKTETTVDLAWDASTSSDVDHYTVYVDGAATLDVPAGTTSATVSNLSSDTTYDLTVTAVDGAGNESSPSNVATVRTWPVEPSPPSSLSSTGTTDSSVDLSWSGSSAGDLDHYAVYQDGSQATTVPAGTTSVTVSGLAAETTYEFSVTAVDATGHESAAAGPVSATTDSAIGGEDWSATLTPVSTSELRVEFDHDSNSDWADIHYTIDQGSQLNYRMTAQTDSHTHTIDGLSSGDTVEFYFTYEDGGLAYDTSSFTESFDPDTDQDPPEPPTALASPSQATTSIDLTWEASTSSDVASYVVYVDGTQSQTVAAGTTATTVGSLSPGTSYDLSVSAVDDADNESTAAGPITVSTTDDTTAPSAPSNLDSPGVDSSSVELSWDAASDAETGIAHYNVYVDGESTPRVQSNATGATVSDLSAGTTYAFTVSAVDEAGNESAKTAPLQVTTPEPDSGETFSGDGWTATLTQPASGELRFEFDHQNDSQWVDVHYTVDNGGQLNYRMTSQGGYHTHTETGLSPGDTVEFYFTYEDGGLAYDSSSNSYTY